MVLGFTYWIYNLNPYLSCRTFSKIVAHLMNIQQKPIKTLRDYIAWFNVEKKFQVQNQDEKVVITAFINGLKLKKLYTLKNSHMI